MNGIEIADATPDAASGGRRIAPAGAMRGLSLRANFSWTFVSLLVYAACQWGMLVVLAKFGSPEMVGQFTLGLSVAAPVISLGSLQLRNVQATDAKREYGFGDYLGLRLTMMLLSTLAIVAIAALSGYRGATAAVVLLVGLAKVFEAISDIFYGLLQRHERMDRIAISIMIKGILSLVVLAGAVALTGSVLWGTAGLAAVWGVLLLFYDVRNGALVLRAARRHGAGADETMLRPRWRPRALLGLAWLALPLGLVQMLISLNVNLPRYFVEHSLGGYELGIFAAIAYIERAGLTIVSALGDAASPRLAHLYAAGDGRGFRALLRNIVLVGVALGVAGVLAALIAGRQILTLLYRAEYARPDLFVGVMIAVGISYVGWFLGYGMTAARYFRAQLPLFAVVTAVEALACLRLVPAQGLRGAVTALVVAAVVQIVGGLWVITRALRTLPGGAGDQGRG